MNRVLFCEQGGFAGVGYVLEGGSLIPRFSCIGAEWYTLFAHTRFPQGLEVP